MYKQIKHITDSLVMVLKSFGLEIKIGKPWLYLVKRKWSINCSVFQYPIWDLNIYLVSSVTSNWYKISLHGNCSQSSKHALIFIYLFILHSHWVFQLTFQLCCFCHFQWNDINNLKLSVFHFPLSSE